MRSLPILLLLCSLAFSGCLKDVEMETMTYFSDPENNDFFTVRAFTEVATNGVQSSYVVGFDFDRSKLPDGAIQQYGLLGVAIFMNGERLANLPGNASSIAVLVDVGENYCFTGAFILGDIGRTPVSNGVYCYDIP